MKFKTIVKKSFYDASLSATEDGHIIKSHTDLVYGHLISLIIFMIAHFADIWLQFLHIQF